MCRVPCKFEQFFATEDRKEFCIRIPFNQWREHRGRLMRIYNFESRTLDGVVSDSLDVWVAENQVLVKHLKKSGIFIPISCEVTEICENPYNNVTSRGVLFGTSPDKEHWRAGSNGPPTEFRELVIRIPLKQELDAVLANQGNISFSCPRSHTTELFSSSFLSSKYSDVNIRTKDATFPCHRVILAARSAVFARMLEYTGTNINLMDMQKETVHQLLQYVYTFNCDCFSKTATRQQIELFIAADRFLMDDLKYKCTEIIAEQIMEENITEVTNLANLFGLKQLIAAVKRFCWRNRSLVMIGGSVREVAKHVFSELTCEPTTECSFCSV